jgi:hypothetical protein
VSIYYDSNPSTMRQVEQILTMDEQVLRNTHLRARSVLDSVNIAREEKNPYVRRVWKSGTLSSQLPAEPTPESPAAS